MKIFMLLVFDVGCINLFSLLLNASPQIHMNQCIFIIISKYNISTVTATTKLLIMIFIFNIFDIAIAFLVLFCFLIKKAIATANLLHDYKIKVNF